MLESQSFHKFQEQLYEKLELAHKMGVPDKDLALMTKKLAEWLEERKDAQSPEQVVLRELWQQAEGREQQVLAELLIKLVEHHHTQHKSAH